MSESNDWTSVKLTQDELHQIIGEQVVALRILQKVIDLLRSDLSRKEAEIKNLKGIK